MRFKTPLAVLAAGTLALGAVACGGDDKSGKPVATLDSFTGQTTSVKLDKGFVKALTSLNVAPAAVGSAKINATGSAVFAVFPITGGDVTYFKPGSVTPYVQGKIYHEFSGLRLTAGSTKVDLTDFLIDPGKSVLTANVSVNGRTVKQSAPLFFLDGRTLKPISIKKSDDTAVLTGTTVKLEKSAAALLNKTFKVHKLKGGLVIGVARIVIDLPAS
ncbi:MAG: hypothetical protein ACR2NB_04305 [Solirubrobacteraceae bacterium]